MPRFGWKLGRRWGCYFTDKEVDRAEIEKNAKDLLAKVQKGEKWTSPRGVEHIPLVVNGEIVGNLWKDVDLNSLEIGAYWVARFGIKVELVHDKEVVGMIWLRE